MKFLSEEYRDRTLKSFQVLSPGLIPKLLQDEDSVVREKAAEFLNPSFKK